MTEATEATEACSVDNNVSKNQYPSFCSLSYVAPLFLIYNYIDKMYKFLFVGTGSNVPSNDEFCAKDQDHTMCKYPVSFLC